MSRQAGKLGRRPGKIPIGLRDLTYYAAGPLPKPPATVDLPNEAVDWQMLGNDRYGDCGVAGLEHGFMADADITHESERFPTAAQAVEYYLSYTGGQDTGVVLSEYLAHVRRFGYYGHSVRAYAPVSVHDVPTLQTAIYMYGFAYTGIVVTAPMQIAFQNQQPWTAAMVDAPVLGGHCVPVCAYDDEHLYAITWGGVQPITYSAWHQMSSEAWAIITGELAKGDGRGISLAALEADLNRL